jgi:glutaredoxin
VERAYPGPRPEKPIELYEFQGCPFCRKVREIVSILDIDVLFYPTPKNGPNFRPKAVELGGKSQFPYMVDPNTGVSMYESDDIIKYLVDKYGDGQVPLPLKLGFLTVRLHTLPLKLHPCCCRLPIGAMVIAFLSLVTLLRCVIYDCRL